MQKSFAFLALKSAHKENICWNCISCNSSLRRGIYKLLVRYLVQLRTAWFSLLIAHVTQLGLQSEVIMVQRGKKMGHSFST